MEEWVGKIWHRAITGAAQKRFPDAAVQLSEIKKSAAVMFRAFGGNGALRVAEVSAIQHGARRSWLQHIAGTGHSVELAWRDEQALLLPSQIDVFAQRELNRELYLWLAALAANAAPDTPGSWFAQNQRLTLCTLTRMPGLKARYRRLVQAQLAIRPDTRYLPEDEKQQERILQEALQHPGQVAHLPPARRALQPVYLWLYPTPHALIPNSANTADETGAHENKRETDDVQDQKRRQGERVESPKGSAGLVLDRFEHLLSWAEYIKVDRATEEDDDLDAARQSADDMMQISVTRDDKPVSKRLRFDLDLPGEASDEHCLSDGIVLPEWDYRREQYHPQHCRIREYMSKDTTCIELPEPLRHTARRLRAQFQALLPTRMWRHAQNEGSEVDIDSFLDFQVDRLRGQSGAEKGLYRNQTQATRELACLLLADLSLSTDAWINNDMRIIDTIRDSLMLFAEALSATGDRFALYGFSSLRRHHVRFHTLKTFGEKHSAQIRGRIHAIKPGYYTRMGAAIRQASQLLSQQGATQRLLLLLTDGKPNDLDLYEGRYGIEDTRMAVIEAKRMGLQPFCVTIDAQAEDYLAHLFGSDGFVVIRNPAQLPRELPPLYARLTR